MNAILLLKNEHEKAKLMLGEIQAASAEQRGRLWAKLEPELKVHEQMEEAALYGPVAEAIGSTDQELKEWPEHHHEEVTELEALIQEIGGLDPLVMVLRPFLQTPDRSNRSPPLSAHRAPPPPSARALSARVRVCPELPALLGTGDLDLSQHQLGLLVHVLEQHVQVRRQTAER